MTQNFTVEKVKRMSVQDRVHMVYDELSEKSEDGGVTPHAVLEASRPEDTPLHNQFTWDDTKAAEKQRLDEARGLLQLIRIEYLPGKRMRGLQNLIIEVEGVKERKYYKVEQIMADDNLKKIALKQLLKELRSIVERYKSHREIYQLINDGKLAKLEQEILTL